MLIILFPIIFILISILVRQSFRQITGMEVFGISILSFSALSLVILELVNMITKVNLVSLGASYSFVTVFLLITCIWLNYSKSIPAIYQMILSELRVLIDSKGEKKFLILSLLGLVILVLLQGLIYPPNNWDSMTYHMARVSNWVGNQSIEHYPTHIYRQIFQPPFAEFMALQVNLLAGSDLFANSIQWFYWLGTLSGVILILENFGASRPVKFLAALLYVTLPMGLLQASSTQNDLIVSFFVVFSVYYILKIKEEGGLWYYIFLGLSIGLAMLTKGTGYIYLAPPLLIFTVISAFKILKFRKIKILGYCFLAAIISVGVNSFQFHRNYQLTNNLLAITETESSMLANEKIGFDVVFSNILKNLALQAGPYPVNFLVTEGVYKIHQLLDLNANDPKTTFENTIFNGAPNFPNNEDTAPNPLHFIILVLGVIFAGKTLLHDKEKLKSIGILMLIVSLQLLLFVGYLKWQPWHSRLHLTYFILLIPIAAIGLINIRIKDTFRNWVVTIVVGYAFLTVAFNFSRPFLPIPYYTSPTWVTDIRKKKYFTNKFYDFEEYNKICNYISSHDLQKIGLIIGSDTWEYPIFHGIYRKDIQPIHIMVDNITKALEKPQSLDCIVSDSGIEENTILYNGIEYNRIYSNHKLINIFIPNHVNY